MDFIVHGVTKSRTWMDDWTEMNWTHIGYKKGSYKFLLILVILKSETDKKFYLLDIELLSRGSISF